jgi:SMODS-associating 2TM, beta-strand rich effector domain
MHQLLSLKAKVTTIVVLTLAIGYVGQLSHRSLEIALIVGVVEAVIVILAAVSWKLVARIGWPEWAVDLNGNWVGTIVSQWQLDPTHPKPEPIPVTVHIRQNWMLVTMRMETDEMVSRTSGEHVEYLASTEELRIKYFFETDPKAAFRGANPPQSGCGALTLRVRSPREASIRYTNDRGLGGDIALKKKGRTSA